MTLLLLAKVFPRLRDKLLEWYYIVHWFLQPVSLRTRANQLSQLKLHESLQGLLREMSFCEVCFSCNLCHNKIARQVA